MVDHNPNPFDFVPFLEGEEHQPTLKTPDEWTQQYGTLYTGYLTVQIQALTPVHIVGDQEAQRRSYLQKGRERANYKILTSSFYERNGTALIPASTIRGCLRAFLEAACNCWASQLTPYYEKTYYGRHIGFSVLDVKHPETQKADRKKIDANLGSAVPPQFYPTPSGNNAIDLASYLFGCVLPKSEQEESGPGFKGRVIFEDAPIETGLAEGDHDYRYGVPDIDDSAFMGGGKPSASSWWYMQPYGIRMRRIKGRPDTCEFIGKGFRGRKFYYHQQPKPCVDWYFDQSHWPVRSDHPLYRIPMQCLQSGKRTQTFRIYFEELPEQLLNLLLFVLFPGNHIRHKLGYGKAYGYGSIAFEFVQAIDNQPAWKIRGNRLSLAERYAQFQQTLATPHELFQACGETLHRLSLEKLAQILWYEEQSPLIFTYPPFGRGGFQPGVLAAKLRELVDQKTYTQFQAEQLVTLTRVDAKALAEKLIERNLRPALHFDVYQEHAEGYDFDVYQEHATGYESIRNRTFERAV
jgi:hypothetical protein